MRLADSDISLLSEVPAVPPPPRNEKISDIPFGEDGPLLDTNDGGPLHIRPVRHYISYPISGPLKKLLYEAQENTYECCALYKTSNTHASCNTLFWHRHGWSTENH
jgi:hypothetical protein